MQRVVADRQRAPREAVLAGDREVPGQVEAAALDPVAGERGEHVLHVRPARLDL
jgi:hypothetical protein